ncbi:MAG: N-acetyl-gamma-glutamyl-phosphate reductase [Actinobacteria bacterium]|nr:N-acetyl-gamma-glutamyl-phosphate reductase [Actinomycetota bacterium]
MGYRVGVSGASGYAGGELLRLLSAHPDFEVVAITAHASAGQPLAASQPALRSLAGMILTETEPEALAEVDLAFLALPHGASGAFAAALPASVRIVDLGADHRLLDAAVYERYYGGTHPGTWTYGLPELPGQRSAIAVSTRVANTGCYAVATTLALAPLIAAGVVEADDLVVVAASGTSGAGRSAKQNLLGSEVMGDVSPYKVGAHQHVPEIKQATGASSLSFTPMLAPMPRGILSTVTARPVAPIDAEEVRAVLTAAYADEPFVHVLAPDEVVHTGATFGSNSTHLQAYVDVDSGRVIVTSAIDNLGKGAAGQAVQNANLMFGLAETAGLAVDGVAP